MPEPRPSGAEPEKPRGPQSTWHRTAFRQLFVPALLVLTVLSWSCHDRVEAELHAAHWGIDSTTAGLLVSLALIWIAEQIYPANPEWNYNVAADPVRGLNRFGRDLFYLTFVTLLNGLVTSWVAAKLSTATVGLHGALGVRWPEALPFGVRVALVFFIVEFFSYWYHRAAHRFEVLWGFHSTHHVITELTGLKALRTHPVDNAIFYIPRTLPLIFIGASANEIVAATFFGCILGVLSHANLDLAETGLGWIINFPRYHAVHHSAVLEESNSNFGCHTVLWDRIFGTFRVEKMPGPVGVTPVGTRTLWQELIWPFYRRVSVVPSADPAGA